MPQPASSVISRASQAAKVPAYVTQSLQFLNAILGDLCDKYDFALARGLYTFLFNTQLTQIGGVGGGAVVSGPNPLPLDYLRTSGSSGSQGAEMSVIYYISGVPYPMIPCDLAEFDIQVMQAGIQSYPWLWATDMSVQQIVGTTTGDVVLNATTLLNIGGIGLSAPPALAVGQSLAGNGIQPGTTLTALAGQTGTLSLPALQTYSQASVMYGNPPVGYVYPPPSGAFTCNLRYQRKMPDITQAQVSAGWQPWFPNDGFLVKELASRLMMISDDQREGTFSNDALQILAAYNKQKDDTANRAHTAILDRRRFGNNLRNLDNTKTTGW